MIRIAQQPQGPGAVGIADSPKLQAVAEGEGQVFFEIVQGNDLLEMLAGQGLLTRVC